METWKKAQSIVGTSKGRPENDFYPTPRSSVIPLLEKEIFDLDVWECACGSGSISDFLIEMGYRVVSTDKYDCNYGLIGIDFLDTVKTEDFPKTIITNPPFNLIYDFIYHAIFDLDIKKMALFAKLSLLEGVKRTMLLEKTPLKCVYVFRKRQTLTRLGKEQKNSGMIAFAWYVWEKDYIGKPTIDWI